MESKKPKAELSRRELFAGAFGLLAVGATVSGVAVAYREGVFVPSRRRTPEDESPLESVPLKPENGEAQSSLVIEWLPDTVKRWKDKIEQYSRSYDLDPNLTAIIMTIESGGDPNADSGIAKGLMQVTDGRAEDVAAKFLHTPRSNYDLTDPDTSIEFGVASLKETIDVFGGPEQGPSWDKTVGLAAAGYYGGNGRANEYFKDGLKGIADQGTYNYVRYATTMWRERHDDRSFAYRHWHDDGNGQALIKDAENYQLPQ